MVSTDEKYRIILDAERNLAYEVAKGVIEKPKVSVWVILMPILFLYYAHKIQTYKKGIQEFAAGLLKTKTAALEAAFYEITSGLPPSDHLDKVFEHDPDAPEKKRFVRLQQRVELNLLLEHYGRLLRSSGADYDSLLRDSYEHGGQYRSFLNRLTKAEEAVNKAVLDAFHPSEEANEIVNRMESLVQKLREKRLNSVFA